jgi:hypothetical protein
LSKLEREYRIHQLKRNVPAILLVLALVFLGVFSVVNKYTGSSYSVTGIVESLSGLPDDTGDKLYLMVRLDDDKLVRSRIQRSTFYKQGSEVKLTALKPRFFGRTIYRYSGYLSESLNNE